MLSTVEGNPRSDEELAALVARRDDSAQCAQSARAACGQLYDRHAPRLLAFLAARMPRSDVEDLHQGVWERVWQRLPASFHGGSFRGWLFQIARNLLIDQSRKRRPETTGNMDLAAGNPSAGPDEQLLEQERAEVLRRCLETQRAQRMFFDIKKQLQDCVERGLAS